MVVIFFITFFSSILFISIMSCPIGPMTPAIKPNPNAVSAEFIIIRDEGIDVGFLSKCGYKAYLNFGKIKDNKFEYKTVKEYLLTTLRVHGWNFPGPWPSLLTLPSFIAKKNKKNEYYLALLEDELVFFLEDEKRFVYPSELTNLPEDKQKQLGLPYDESGVKLSKIFFSPSFGVFEEIKLPEEVMNLELPKRAFIGFDDEGNFYLINGKYEKTGDWPITEKFEADSLYRIKDGNLELIANLELKDIKGAYIGNDIHIFGWPEPFTRYEPEHSEIFLHIFSKDGTLKKKQILNIEELRQNKLADPYLCIYKGFRWRHWEGIAGRRTIFVEKDGELKIFCVNYEDGGVYEISITDKITLKEILPPGRMEGKSIHSTEINGKLYIFISPVDETKSLLCSMKEDGELECANIPPVYVYISRCDIEGDSLYPSFLDSAGRIHGIFSEGMYDSPCPQKFDRRCVLTHRVFDGKVWERKILFDPGDCWYPETCKEWKEKREK